MCVGVSVFLFISMISALLLFFGYLTNLNANSYCLGHENQTPTTTIRMQFLNHHQVYSDTISNRIYLFCSTKKKFLLFAFDLKLINRWRSSVLRISADSKSSISEREKKQERILLSPSNQSNQNGSDNSDNGSKGILFIVKAKHLKLFDCHFKEKTNENDDVKNQKAIKQNVSFFKSSLCVYSHGA